MRSLESCRLYGILDAGYLAGRDPAQLAEQMLAGGADILQLRAKGMAPASVLDMARAVLPVTRRFEVPLVINDHPAVAEEAGAQAVHVGQDDLSVAEVRRTLRRVPWVGKSTHSLDQAQVAEAEGADYIGVGPVFATPTKPDYRPVGLELVRKVSGAVKLPFFCIGGIKLENAMEVLAAGAARIVVVSGILQAPDPEEYCRRLKALLPG